MLIFSVSLQFEMDDPRRESNGFITCVNCCLLLLGTHGVGCWASDFAGRACSGHVEDPSPGVTDSLLVLTCTMNAQRFQVGRKSCCAWQAGRKLSALRAGDVVAGRGVVAPAAARD